MKMVMAVVSRQEAKEVVSEVVASGRTATAVESRGGVLRQQYDTLFIAVEDEDLEDVLGIIGRSCHSCVSVERQASPAAGPAAPSRDIAEVGGAVVFVWELESFGRY
jgi:uncharacterized protein YaaQ